MTLFSLPKELLEDIWRRLSTEDTVQYELLAGEDSIIIIYNLV